MQSVGKVTYQTFKKLYGLFFLEFSTCWVIDSESKFIRPMYVRQELERYLKNPFVFTFSLSESEHWAQTTTAKAAITLLDINIDQVPSLGVSYQWIYEKDIVNQFKERLRMDLFNSWKEPYLFESILYFSYVYVHAKELNYTMVDVGHHLRDVTNRREHLSRDFSERTRVAIMHFYEHYPFWTFSVQMEVQPHDVARAVSFLQNNTRVKVLTNTPNASWLEELGQVVLLN